MFNDFEDFLNFCKYLKNNTSFKLKKSVLYKYNSKYYLCINIDNLDIFKSVHYLISEFGIHINSSGLFERKLAEYGKIVFETNAINNCMKYFN